MGLTKEELEEMCKLEPKSNEEMLFQEAIIDFLENYVCIPKGTNRHPDADLLHTLAEDILLRIEYHNITDVDNDTNWKYFDIVHKEYRIKPSEPAVYEYRFTYQDYDGTVGISDYLSEKDAIISLVDVSNVSKLEWTKRVRNA